MLLPCLTLPRGRPLAFPDFRVWVGTRLQLSDVFSIRAVRFERFVASTVAPSFPKMQSSSFAKVDQWRTLEHLCRLYWENSIQEPYRRLVVNGLATGERVGGQHCTCHATLADRDHLYWTCPLWHRGGGGAGGGAHHGPQPLEACRPFCGAALSYVVG